MAQTFIINIHLLTIALLVFIVLCFLFSSLVTSLFVVSANLKPPSLFFFLPCLHVQQTIDVPMRHLYKQSGRCKAAPWQERCSFYLQEVCSPSKAALWQAFGLYWIVGESADVWVNEFLVPKMLSPTVSTCMTKLLCGPILNIIECWPFDRSIAFSYGTLSLVKVQYFNTLIEEGCLKLILFYRNTV